jgi:DNA-binding CsgD family transcriptional regulator
MSLHHTTPKVSSPSQTGPSTLPKMALNTTWDETYVLLCDWHGRLVWKSGLGDRVQIGDYIWSYATKKSKDTLRAAVASVATLRESRTLEVEGARNEYFRLRMWPLDEPEVALCMLAMRIPSELALLTDREKACLACLAQGLSTRDIAEELDIGLTTVHTHLRRSRAKLGLDTAEALIGFAARYLYVPTQPPAGELAATHKISG